MKNKVSFFIFTITLFISWNLASAMDFRGEAKKCEEGTESQQLQQVRLRETTAEDSDSVAGTSSAVARLTLEDGAGPQENSQAPEPSPEETLITQFRMLVLGAGCNEEEQHDLHRCLKQLQQAEFLNFQTSSFQTSFFTWNNEAQQFVHYSEHPNAILTELDDEVLEVLNAYVTYDREKRRADVPAWQEQDPSQPSLLATLLSPTINLQQLKFKIAHRNGEETFDPQPLDQGNITLQQDHAILLYGFNVPGKGGPRLQVKAKLQTLFAPLTIQAMNDYNKAIGLSAAGIKFPDYLRFVSEAKKRNLRSSILGNAPLSTLPISRPQAEEWAKFLERHLRAFDFSRRLTSPEAAARFVAKNYKNITTNKGISDLLKEAFDANEWSVITGYLEPIFAYLHNIERDLIASLGLEDAQIDNVSAALGAQSRFSHLQLPPERENDLNLVLASIVSEAFFRTTSELGLKFARQQSIQVGFVWTHSFSPLVSQPLSSLQEFQNYMERKPYYKADFRRNNNNAKYPEAITCSEARCLGRLKANNTAPSFLLIREICPPDAL